MRASGTHAGFGRGFRDPNYFFETRIISQFPCRVSAERGNKVVPGENAERASHVRITYWVLGVRTTTRRRVLPTLIAPRLTRDGFIRFPRKASRRRAELRFFFCVVRTSRRQMIAENIANAFFSHEKLFTFR